MRLLDEEWKVLEHCCYYSMGCGRADWRASVTNWEEQRCGYFSNCRSMDNVGRN